MSEGYVYICRREKSVSGLVKIGHTDDLERRVAEFNRETGADSKMILEVAFACAADLRHSLERAAHRLGRKHRSRGEWFRLSADEAVKTVRAAAAELGINAAICYKKDQPQGVTDRIRRQSDQEFVERCRQREAKAADLAAAAYQADVDARAAIATEAKVRLETHLHTPPSHDIAALAAIREEEHKRALWLANYRIEQANDALCNKYTFRLIMPLVAVVLFFAVVSHPDMSSSQVVGGIVSSIILSAIATVLTSTFIARPLIFTFAARVPPLPASIKFPKVEAAHTRRVEAAKGASVAGWNARRDELVAAYQQATERLDAVTLEKIKFDTRRALDGLASKVADSQESLLGKPYAFIENILCKAYRGRHSADRWHQDMDDLLIASHVIEFNSYAELSRPAQYFADGTYFDGFDAAHPASSITNTDAQETITRLTTGNTNATEATALAEAIGVYRTMISNLQDFVIDKGLETKKTINRWRESFPNYTPLDREYGRHHTYGAGEIPGTSGFFRLETGSHRPFVSPLESTLNFGMNLVKRGEMATTTQILLNFARTNAPTFLTTTGDRKAIWVVDALAPVRKVKWVNVYTVIDADGGTSREYYNRDQAKRYADAQQVKWSAANPGQSASQSPVKVDFLGLLQRVHMKPPSYELSTRNVLVIPENGINHVITFNEESEDAMAILASFTGYPLSETFFHRAS